MISNTLCAHVLYWKHNRKFNLDNLSRNDIVNLKGATAHKVGWSNKGLENHPATGQSLGVVFLCSYLQNVKTNVSNAKRNMPKVSKSLKSKRFFIGITSIPQEYQVSPPCNTVAPLIYYHISICLTIVCMKIVYKYI